jgi:phosphoserine phosphatase
MYKDEAVMNLAEKSGIPVYNIAAVGNSCFDIAMFETCGLSIAFNPDDECTKNSADFVVLKKDLSLIVPFLKKYIQ